MPEGQNRSVHANYHALSEQVDEFCQRICHDFTADINCRPGCSGCCRHLTLFPVEAANLAEAMGRLPAEVLAALQPPYPGTDGPCPLLKNDRCLVYAARPIICRTHGLPLITRVDGESRVDFCPENFKDRSSLPGSAVINLEALNHVLVTINTLFVRETPDPEFAVDRRFSIAEIIILSVKKLKGL